jgi:hypothetical protein
MNSIKDAARMEMVQLSRISYVNHGTELSANYTQDHAYNRYAHNTYLVYSFVPGHSA